MLLRTFIVVIWTFNNIREQVSAEILIVNGEDVGVGKIPFQVSLQENGGHFCGGSIINEYYILTAAHCGVDRKASLINVVVGTVDLLNPYKSYKAAKIVIHEDYDANMSFRNDIALIRVDNPISFNERVKPVELPYRDEGIKAGTPVVVSGWGRLYGPFTVIPAILQEATIFVTKQKKCYEIYKKLNISVFPTNICANDPHRRRGLCLGDSGGPLTAKSNDKLFGIVSWTVLDPNCGSPKYPGVYTRVPDYIDWIRKNQN